MGMFDYVNLKIKYPTCTADLEGKHTWVVKTLKKRVD